MEGGPFLRLECRDCEDVIPQVLSDFIIRDLLLYAGFFESLLATDTAAEKELRSTERSERKENVSLGVGVVTLRRRVIGLS